MDLTTSLVQSLTNLFNLELTIDLGVHWSQNTSVGDGSVQNLLNGDTTSSILSALWPTEW
jgi:hypothetical protein